MCLTGGESQKSAAEGTDYCKRKVMYLKDKLDQIGGLIKEKQRVLVDINGALARRQQRAPTA